MGWRDQLPRGCVGYPAMEKYGLRWGFFQVLSSRARYNSRNRLSRRYIGAFYKLPVFRSVSRRECGRVISRRELLPIHLGLGYSPIGRTHKRGQQLHCKLSLFTAHQSPTKNFHHHHPHQQPPLSLSFLQKQQNIVASMPTPTENDSIRIKGEKRSPELESPVNKKAKITNGKTISPKTHSTNLIFRKFVNNALTEKAAVGFLCIPSFLQNISLTMDYRGTQ